MKKLFAVIVMALAVSASVQAIAETREVDILELPCGAALQGEGVGAIMMWIDGYISADQGISKISPEWQKKLGSFVMETCNENPETKIIEIIERSPSKKR